MWWAFDVMSETPVAIGLQATDDTSAVMTDDAVGFLRPGRHRTTCFRRFKFAM